MKKGLMKFLLNQRGLSLPEVLMGAGMLALVALGMTKMMDQGYKRSADLGARAEGREIRDDFYVAVRNSDCGLTHPDVALETLNIKLDETSEAPIVIDKLYGKYGQIFSPEDKIGTKLSIAKNGAFKISPPPDNSPLTKGVDPKYLTPGKYYKIDGRILAQLTILLEKSKGSGGGTLPLHYLLFLTVRSSDNVITDCQSIAEVKAAAETCTLMNSGDGKLEYEFNEETLKCDVTFTEDDKPVSNILNSNDPGSVNPLYVYPFKKK